MATYMYTSTTGSNWDDDEDFDSSVYSTIFESSAPPTKTDLAHHHQQSAVHTSDESEPEQGTSPASSESNIDFDCDPDFWPTYAQKVTQSWYFPSSRPAFPELSHDDEFAYPDERVQYHANWTAAKLRVGANMRHPLMMRPSPLRLSKTWVRDGHAEFVKDDGFSFSQESVPSPLLGTVYDSSEEEQDEARTPPGSPPTGHDVKCEEEVEEYDPITDTIDTAEYGIDVMDYTHDFVDFSSIAEDLDVADVLGDAACNMHHDCIEGPLGVTSILESPQFLSIDARHHIEVSKKAEPTTELTATTVGATRTKRMTNASPDLKYIHDPTNTSLVWNTVAAGWFVLSSVPWGRIAVAAAGALVDVATFMARS